METPRRASAVRTLVALALLPVLGACATSEPDVVATRVPAHQDGGGFSFTELHTCQEGRYGGSFASSSNDGSFASTLKGPIAFELVKQGNGEFYSITPGEKLQGSSEQGDKFSADIDSDKSGCRVGQFTVELIHGAYTPVGTTNEYQFTGTVTGKYVVSANDGGFTNEGGFFLGSWQSFVLGVKIAQGNWSAVWFGPVRDSGTHD
jgi:hypothetical protein